MALRFQVGFGYDVHRLVSGRKLMVGGIAIPHDKGALGHSDADVLLHALADALLGAAALGDLGTHFPDTDSRFKDMDSSLMLTQVKDLLYSKGWKVQNLDTTVVLQAPRLQPFIPAIKKRLAVLLDIGEESVSVKATTTEQLGFTGREEGIAAYAVVMVYSE